jgi:hypothetical protein
MNFGLLRSRWKRTIHHGRASSEGLIGKVLSGKKLEGKMGGAVTTAFAFLLLLLMFGALGFMFGNFD